MDLRSRGSRLPSLFALLLIATSVASVSLPHKVTPVVLTNGMPADIVIGEPDFVAHAGSATQNGLSYPWGLAFDSSGDLWVADTLSSRILEYVPPLSSGMSASVVIGQPNFTSRVASCPTMPPYVNPTRDGLCDPDGIAFDHSGDLWVADNGSSRILEFVPPFQTGMQASLVIGQSNFTSDSRQPPQSSISYPFSVAFDSSGDLWASSVNGARVLEYVPPFSDGMVASLVIGQRNLTSFTRECGSAPSLCVTGGISFDSSGNLWVAEDWNNRVLGFSYPFQNCMSPTYVIGEPNFTDVSCTGACLESSGPSTARGLSSPESVSFDASGDMWVTDTGNSRLLEFVPPLSNGMQASGVIGQSNFTSNACASTQTGLCYAFDVALDPAGGVWVADGGNNRVLGYGVHPQSSTTSSSASSSSSSISFSFSVSVVGDNFPVYPGGTVQIPVQISLVSGTADQVSLSVAWIPTGSNQMFVTHFSDATNSPPFSSTLYAQASSSAIPGQYTVQVLASGGGKVHSVEATVLINNPNNVHTAWNPLTDFYSFQNYGLFNDGGDCTGFSSTAVLYFRHYGLGDHAYPYYPEPTTSVAALPGPTSSDTLSQSTFPIYIHQEYDRIPSSVNPSDEQEQAVLLEESIRAGIPVVLVLGADEDHAIVAWGYSQSSDGSLTISISDPNFGNKARYAYYANDQFSYTGQSGSSPYTWTAFSVWSPEVLQWSWLASTHVAVSSGPLNQYYWYVFSDVPVTIRGIGSSAGQASFGTLGDSMTFENTISGVVGLEEGGIQAYGIPVGTSFIIGDPGRSSSQIMIVAPQNSTSAVGYLLTSASSAPLGMSIAPTRGELNVTTSNSIDLSVAFFSASKQGYSVFNATSVIVASSQKAAFTVPDWNKLGSSESAPTVQFFAASSGQPTGGYTLTNGTQTATRTTSTTASTTAGGGIPEFPAQLGLALLATVSIVASYVVTRRIARSKI